jgi:hypothetical protein
VIADRLRGVLAQYGPAVAFLTGELLLGHTRYLKSHLPSDEGASNPPLRDGLVLLAADGRHRRGPSVWVPTPPGGGFGLDALPVWLDRGVWPLPMNDPRLAAHAHPFHYDERGFYESLSGEARCFSPSAERLVPWIARTIHRWLEGEERMRDLVARAAAPDLAASVLATYYQPMVWLQQNLGDVMDWRDAVRPPILSLSLGQVRWRKALWEARASRRGFVVVNGRVVTKRPESPVVFDCYPYRIERLTTPEALAYEGAAQRHCVGQPAYQRAVASGDVEIYSVVDERRGILATVEVHRVGHFLNALGAVYARSLGQVDPVFHDRRVMQVKGKANQPVHDPTVLLTLMRFCEQESIAYMLPGYLPGMRIDLTPLMQWQEEARP